jgi:uncharacterized protein DUF6918
VPTLKELLCAPEIRWNVIRDTAQLVESEVASKSGISGLAIKAGYKAVKAIKPSLIPDAIDNMLDRFVERLEPFYTEWSTTKAQPIDSFLNARASQVANALLSVTDDRARSIQNGTIKKTYDTLRPHGEKNVIAAVPGLGRMISRYAK